MVFLDVSPAIGQHIGFGVNPVPVTHCRSVRRLNFTQRRAIEALQYKNVRPVLVLPVPLLGRTADPLRSE
jgi:hypothetical protein